MISVLGYGTWTPPFTVKRSADPSIALPKDVPVRVSSDGLVVWSVEALTTTICDADPFFFPADTMDCPICFSAKTTVDLTIQCQEDGSEEDESNSPCDTFSASRIEGEWHRKDKIFAKDNREACFHVHLARAPLFHIATTVGPCIILVVLMLITFIMPIDKGDRISFGVTIQLSMVVSLVFVTEVLPVKGALPFFATLIIVCMGLMGLFLFFTIGIIIIYDRKENLSPLVKTLFLRHMSRMLLLGDLTKKSSPSHDEIALTIRNAIDLIERRLQTDDMAVIDLESPGNDLESAERPRSGLETTGSPNLRELISSVKAMKDEMGELIKNMADDDEEVTDYTLLAKVLDRLCLVMYVISIAVSVPITMYFGK
ncbi:acetylcholine receptor subunit delta-like [Branchiostoma lanceolatum]|uniref:acetylcholine receptor subunit delta-like n=1 Tax=Branchiostoma lanceolatum TaxID=7740 RepID=UPI003451E409